MGDTRRVFIIALAYGLALSAVETLIMLAGHGTQMPALARASVYAATVAVDVAAAIAFAMALYGIAALFAKVIPLLRGRAPAFVEIGLVSVILALNGVLIVRSKLFVGLPLTHPYKLGAFAVCAAGAVAVAAAWRALRPKIVRRPVLIAAAAAYVVAGAALFVRPELKSAAQPKTAGPNVIFISLDTVRADHLGCYGYKYPTSPHLDRLARGAILYENAVCVQPTTNPSHASMFTGLYPAEHGVLSNFVPLRAGVPTLPQLLAAHGYESVAVIGGFPLDRRISGLGRGFRYYDDYINPWSYLRHTILYRFAVALEERLYGTLRPAPNVTAGALRILRQRRNRPLFLFVHYFDPHHPYFYHGAAERFYAGSEPVDFEKQQLELKRRWNKYKEGTPRPSFAPAMEALYDDEIHFTDKAVGDLLHALRRSGNYDRTLIAVASDHGESFGEHGYKYHGQTVYDPEIKVCLLIKPVGDAKGSRVRTQVETRALARTILAAAGAPAAGYRGTPVDLLNLGGNPKVKASFGFSQTNDKTTLANGTEVSARYCVRSADAKLISDLVKKRYEYYDLTTDAGETSNLYGRVDAASYEIYRGELTRHIEGAAAAASGRVGGDLADALRSLGYTN
jgi:arylsulfatase A-like enzyme